MIDWERSDKTSLYVGWSAPDAQPSSLITGYYLQMDDGRGGQYSTIYDGSENTGDLSYHVMGLETGYFYNFRAYAINFNGLSDPSDSAGYYVCVEPSGIQPVKVTAQSQTQISVDWSEPLDDGGCSILSYVVYRDDGLGGDISTEVNESNDPLVRNLPSLNALTITNFPASSSGRTFRF